MSPKTKADCSTVKMCQDHHKLCNRPLARIPRYTVLYEQQSACDDPDKNSIAEASVIAIANILIDQAYIDKRYK
jgi:hypothetical protein